MRMKLCFKRQAISKLIIKRQFRRGRRSMQFAEIISSLHKGRRFVGYPPALFSKRTYSASPENTLLPVIVDQFKKGFMFGKKNTFLSCAVSIFREATTQCGVCFVHHFFFCRSLRKCFYMLVNHYHAE